KALQKKFLDYEVYLSEIHKAIAKYYSRKQKDILNNTALLYEELVRRKNKDSQYLLELAEALETSIEKKIKKAKYTYWKIQILLTSSATILSQTLFPKLDKALSQFIMSEIQKI
ncbi:11742_t:CDS:2, partial [Scutellospora calospora]